MADAEGKGGHETYRVVDAFLSSATIHGLGRAASSDHLVQRVVWIVLLLGMLVSLSLVGYTEVTSFFRYNTLTNSYIDTSTENAFPAVTICNMNEVKKSVMGCADLRYLMFYLSELSDFVTLPIPAPGNSSRSGKNITRCLQEHFHGIDMFRYCFWEGRIVNCSTILQATITSMGQCFTFNGGPGQIESQMYSSFGGLRVAIDIQQYEYFFTQKTQTGVKVILHEPTEDPLPGMSSSFVVGPGQSAEAVLSRTKVDIQHLRVLLPPPHGNCSSDVINLSRFSGYSYKLCLTECFYNSVVSHCDCRRHFIPGPERICNQEETIHCYKAFTNNVTAQMSSNHQCRSCPHACTSYMYDWSLSYARFGSDFISELLFNASIIPSKQYLSENYIELNLYYNTPKELVVEDVPAKQFGDIIGNVGGQMGLFLGASLLSIVELVEFVCLLMTKQRRIKHNTIDGKDRNYVRKQRRNTSEN